MAPLHLSSGDWSADLVPDDGAGMTALRFGGQDILVPVPEGSRLGGPFGAFWMIPWANRLDGGRLGPHRLPINRPQEGHAIHGLSRDWPWVVETAAPDRAVLTQAVDVAPYHYTTRLVVALGPAGLSLDLTVTGGGDMPTPFGAGWHPWFRRPPGTTLSFRATHRCTHDARGLPIAAEPSTGLDGGEEAFLGLDTHFPGWDGAVMIAWPGLTLHMAATGALANALQVYAPRDRPVLCVEPSSHMTDALNRPDLARLGPMQVLAPGESLTGIITLTAEGSHLPKGAA
ncbi:aldose epimerase [Roseomonas sp. CAU 1739]|uniref:aldose epimerase family protein n=1 Tax=Roseomonas sp. CAU 1739 TaxID=3140364 RepID=UPI00325ADA9D